jgi:lipopolysaccharide transport protein LptA
MSGARRSGAPIAAVVACALCLAPGRVAAEQAPIEVEAARVELDRERGEVLFTGGVLLRHGQVELRCDRMRARTDESGQLGEVEASGDVRLTVGGGGVELRATAGSARYDPATGRLVLGGSPRVRGPSGALSGRAITIDARTGRVTIEEAHGVFRLQ